MQICSQRANDYNSSVTEDEINSAVRKAGSFEGTLPRCSLRSGWEQSSVKPPNFCLFHASFRLETSKWVTQAVFSGFSVEFDFADCRYLKKQLRAFAD